MNNESYIRMAEAFSAAKAAINNKAYIFECQCGLVKAAIPIIVNNQYLGAIICGCVRTDDLEFVDPSSRQPFVHRDFLGQITIEDESLFEKIPVFSIHKIKAVTDLVSFTIREMCQKEDYALKLGNTEHKEVHLMELRKKNMELQNTIKNLEMISMKCNLQPQLLLNMLVFLSNSSIMEEAKVTQDMIQTCSGFLRYYIEYNRDLVPLLHEMEHIEKFLHIIKMQYEKRFEIDIRSSNENANQLIPKMVVFPLMEYVLSVGILSSNVKGTLHMEVTYSAERCIVSIRFEHKEDNISYMGYLKESGNIIDERSYLEQLNQIEKRIAYEYGNNYSLSIDPDLVVLDIPRSIGNQ